MMKLLFLLLLGSSDMLFADWQPDFVTAQKKATEEGKYILLNFSGSDWCAPCIRLRKEVFDSDAFEQVADRSLVCYNADFPRSKRNQLSKDLQRQNESLADQYNPLGKFPYTVILTATGKVVKAWEGYPNNNSAQFIEQIKGVCNAGRN